MYASVPSAELTYIIHVISYVSHVYVVYTLQIQRLPMGNGGRMAARSGVQDMGVLATGVLLKESYGDNECPCPPGEAAYICETQSKPHIGWVDMQLVLESSGFCKSHDFRGLVRCCGSIKDFQSHALSATTFQ